MAVTKMARPRMVTRMISEVTKEAKGDVMLQDKYYVITVRVMDI